MFGYFKEIVDIWCYNVVDVTTVILKFILYIELGRWLCSHFQQETPVNFYKPIIQK